MHGCGNDSITHKFTPVAEEFVAGQNNAPLFIPFADESEKQFCLCAVKQEMADLVSFVYEQARVVCVWRQTRLPLLSKRGVQYAMKKLQTIFENYGFTGMSITKRRLESAQAFFSWRLL